MTLQEKQQKLKTYKVIALALLLFMAVVYIVTFFFYQETMANGFVRSFAEAAMVGALADWFAVTALFRYPMGIPIPHTNIIKANKDKIGTNLGTFVTENFLNPKNIRPRIEKLQISAKLGEWLNKPTNRNLLISEITQVINNALNQVNDDDMEALISKQAQNLIGQTQPAKIVGNVIKSIVDNGLHEEWVSLLTKQAGKYIETHPEIIKEKVKQESNPMIPVFIENFIATKISNSLQQLLSDMSDNLNHPQRILITEKLSKIATDIQTQPEWNQRIDAIKERTLPPEKIKQYSGWLWQQIKKYLLENLNQHKSGVNSYLDNLVKNIAKDYLSSSEKSRTLDEFVRVHLFKLVMRHRQEATRLISTTVGDWDSKSLSRKLELEVGKDLQFIRFNGTLIGGLVGLLIHAITLLFHYLY